MKIFIIALISVLSVTALTLLIFHIKTLKPFRSILLHAGIGLTLLISLNLLTRFTGIRIPINPISIISAATLGAPAVCGYLILNLIL